MLVTLKVVLSLERSRQELSTDVLSSQCRVLLLEKTELDKNRQIPGMVLFRFTAFVVGGTAYIEQESICTSEGERFHIR